MNVRACLFLLLSSLCAVALPASAQDYLYATGSPVYATSLPIDHGIVNVNNGDVHLEIPIAAKQQRGAFALNEKLIYDSRIWKIVQSGSTVSWSPTNVAGSNGGWVFSSGAGSGNVTYSSYGGTDSNPPACQGYGNDTGGTQSYSQYTQWQWTDASGTVHTFPGVSTVQYGQPNNPHCLGTSPGVPTSSGIASDGSGYYLSVTNYTNATITDAQGHTYTPQVMGNGTVTSEITDRNGNYWTTDSNGNLIDTSGLTPVMVTTSGSKTYYDVLGVNGVRNRYTVTMEAVSFHTALGEQGVTEASGSFNAIQSITLPDGSAYSFTYDSGTSSGSYGELKSMTLPTGGVIMFGYTNYMDSFNNENRWLNTIVKDGGTTTFTPAVISKCSSSAGCQQNMTVTGAGGNATVYTFNLDKAGLIAGSSWVSGIKSYQGSASSGTLLRTTTTTYTYTSYSTETDENATYVVTGSYETPQSLVNTVTLNDVGLTSQTTAELFNEPCPQEVKVWNFGNAASNPPDTDTVYSGTCGSPAGVVVKDGSGNQLSSVTYGYDETTPANAPSGLPNYTAISSTARGNRTSEHDWINTTGATLTTTMTYDDAGTMLTSTSPNGTTRYGHDSTDTFVLGALEPTPSSGALLEPLAAYDSSTGAVTSTTDAAGQKTTYSGFDEFNRLTAASYPDGGSATFSYQSSTQSGIQQVMSSSQSSNTQFETDSYGRASRKAVNNGQSSNPWIETDTCYNPDGEVSFVSYPYAGPGFGELPQCANTGNGHGGDAYTYGALGRVSQVTHADGSTQSYFYKGRAVESVDENGVTKITQTDAFGRTTAVCEVTSTTLQNSGSPVNCGLDYPGSGYLTTYAYNLASHTTTITQGAQTRIFTTDSLGRTVSTQEPEAGLNTFTYAYNSTGLLVTRVRPQANQSSGAKTTTQAQYDSVGRVTSVTYSDGTPEHGYYYDEPIDGSGGAGENLKGRLSQATTDFSTGVAATSFTYDPMGRITQTNTCLPGQCSTFGAAIGYGYDHAGNLTAEGSAAMGTISSSYDIESNLATISLTPVSQSTLTVLSNVQPGPTGPMSYQLGNGLYGVPSENGR
jgi:hypothetical protein